MCKLAECYNEGLGVTQNHKMSVQWYQKAANLGDAESQNLIGECHLKGDVLPRDVKKAAKWFGKSAKQGYREAEYNLGMCYYNGTGLKKDYRLAAVWLGVACGLYIVKEEMVLEPPKTIDAVMEDDRIVGAVDEKEVAEDILQLKALAGDVWAQYKLGEQNLKRGAAEDAMFWLTKATEQGHYNAQKRLAWLYVEGVVVEKDYERAFYWHKKAHDEESDISVGGMLYDLWKDAYNENNYHDFSLLIESATMENPKAMLTVSCLLAKEEDILKRDDNLAVELYRRYLEKSGTPKQDATIADVYYYIYDNYYSIQRILCDKDDYDKDQEQWLEKAAMKGLDEAQYELGEKFYLGDEYEKAVYCFAKQLNRDTAMHNSRSEIATTLAKALCKTSSRLLCGMKKPPTKMIPMLNTSLNTHISHYLASPHCPQSNLGLYVPYSTSIPYLFY